MKKIINAIRDFIYSITDYGLIISVIAVMAVILVWRFNILFNKGIDKNNIGQLPPIIEQPEKENPEEDPEETSETPVEEQLPVTVATISIPQGSYPSQIADILLSKDLIENKNEFLTRTVELGLDTRLRSGTYNIETGTSVDDIIKILANAN